MTEVEKWRTYVERLEAQGKKNTGEYEAVITRLSRAWQLDGLCAGCGGQTLRRKGTSKPRKWCCDACCSTFNGRRAYAKNRAQHPLMPEAERKALRGRRFYAEVGEAKREIFGYLGRHNIRKAAARQDHRCSTCDRLGAELTVLDSKAVYRCSICRRRS